MTANFATYYESYGGGNQPCLAKEFCQATLGWRIKERIRKNRSPGKAGSGTLGRDAEGGPVYVRGVQCHVY